VNAPLPAAGALAAIAAYRFAAIENPDSLRQRLLAECLALDLRGTIILALEGINVALAGSRSALQTWLAAQADLLPAHGVDIKWQACSTLPFSRLKVKVKSEIIRMNQPTVRPQSVRAPTVDAKTLARWLQLGHCDAGRQLALLDTRNAFEVNAGAFAGAIDWRLSRFSDFPQALSEHANTLHGKTVVSYCTGGIRCEKAALWMAQQGMQNVLQLDGGILRYLEATAEQQAPGWQGDCVVFDERIALNTRLAPASAAVA